MSSKLEDFLKTGQIGTIALGMSPTETMQLLGEPDFFSEKVNPSVFKYGRVELTFWKAQGERSQRLREIVVSYSQDFERLPQTLEFADWPYVAASTEREFLVFLDQIDYQPIRDRKGIDDRELLFASGVSATFLRGVLHSLRARNRDIRSQPNLLLSDKREPTKHQILEMLEEGDRANEARAHSAAVLIVWAALEAILRRLAIAHELSGKTRVQPAILLNDLVSANILKTDDARLLQHMRQVRMAIAHGLKSDQVDSSAAFHRLMHIARRLAERLKWDKEMNTD